MGTRGCSRADPCSACNEAMGGRTNCAIQTVAAGLYGAMSVWAMAEAGWHFYIIFHIPGGVATRFSPHAEHGRRHVLLQAPAQAQTQAQTHNTFAMAL